MKEHQTSLKNHFFKSGKLALFRVRILTSIFQKSK